MEENYLKQIVSQFAARGTVETVAPLGDGLINTTYKATTREEDAPDYVLQLINHHVFPDVDMLMHNIVAVTDHLRRKLAAQGVQDLERHCLRFLPLRSDPACYYLHNGEHYWRLMEYIPRSITPSEVTPESAHAVGIAFGQFESMLCDISEPIGEVIPDFHNMEYRLRQLRDALEADRAGRAASVKPLVDELFAHADEMTAAERLHREGKLPKRICHCDTKVNNMLFDANTRELLCVIDLDTVMPSYVFSDFGDFMRTAGSSAPEDEPDLGRIDMRMDIFRPFASGYMESAGGFLTPLEASMLPYAVELFPYMQAVRFLADYIDGDLYYRTSYGEHNLVRAKAQYKLYQAATAHHKDMAEYIENLQRSSRSGKA